MQGACARRNAEPTFIKGEAFWSPDQLEKLVSDTSAEKLGLFVSEDAQPLKTLSFHRGCQIYYLVYRLSDCVKRQSLSPSERKRQRSSRLRRIHAAEEAERQRKADEEELILRERWSRLAARLPEAGLVERVKLLGEMMSITKCHPSFAAPRWEEIRNRYRVYYHVFPKCDVNSLATLARAFGGKQWSGDKKHFVFPTQGDLHDARKNFERLAAGSQPARPSCDRSSTLSLHL